MDDTIFKLSSEYNDYRFEGRTFNKIILERSIEGARDIVFHNCIFEESVILENINCRELNFSECTFKKEIHLGSSQLHFVSFRESTCTDINVFTNKADLFSLRKVKAQNVKVNGDYTEFQVVSSIMDSLLLNDINVSHSHKESKINFLVENEIDELKLRCSKSYSSIFFKGGKYDSVFFEGEFLKSVNFNGDLSIDSLYFESAVFGNRIDFEKGKFNSLYFYRSYFKGLIRMDDLSILDQTRDKISLNQIDIHSCTFEKDVIIHVCCKIKNFNSSNSSYKELLNFNNFCTTRDISNLTQISMDGVSQGSVVLANICGNIYLSGINFGSIYLKDIIVDTFYMSEYQNKGGVSFSNIVGGRFFVIQDSISGNMNFLNSDINEFKEIIIADSNIDGVNFNKYPNRILASSKCENAGYGIKSKSQRIINKKNIYNQLKKISKQKGEIDIANRFESLEYRQLLLSKKFGFDSVLLLLNFFSNNNGRSWFQGVIFSLTIGCVFFIWYLNTIGIPIHLDNGNFYEEYILFMSSFPKLELEKYDSSKTYWYTQLVLWLSRIFISYGIYQTIAAFRKYGKS